MFLYIPDDIQFIHFNVLWLIYWSFWFGWNVVGRCSCLCALIQC